MDLKKDQKTQEGLLLEVSRDDPRYSSNAKTKLTDSTLGSLGDVLDSVFNPLKNNRLITAAYASYLDCKEEDLVTSRKTYPSYKGPLIRFVLGKMDSHKFEELSIPDEKESIKIDGGEKDLEVIEIGPKKTAKVPFRFNFGVKDSKGHKFCFSTRAEWNGFIFTFYYDGSKDGEKAVDGFTTALEALMDKLNFYRGGRISPTGQFLDITPKTWKDIELPEDTKVLIQNHIINIVEKEEVYEKNGISSKRGLLFVGRPGTGKTLVCKILASQLDAFTFIWVTANDLRSAHDVESIYEMARELAPTIVLLEDADLFCMDRNMGARQPILGEILSQLDGLVELKRVVTIMTSNQPGALDKALTQRPGRFDVQIVFNPPELEGRISLLSKALSKVKFDKKDVKEVSGKADGLTGAQLRELANLAVIYAIDEDSLTKDQIAIVKDSHLSKALASHLKSLQATKGDYLDVAKIQVRKEDNFGMQMVGPEPLEDSMAYENIQPDPEPETQLQESVAPETISQAVTKRSKVLDAISQYVKTGPLGKFTR